MEREDVQERRSIFVALFTAVMLPLIALLAAGIMAPAYADESISVSCYKDAKSSWPLGNVVVYDVADAAGACNAVYYDCRGKCVGCFNDYDYVDNVCVDTQGNKFLR